MYFRCKKGHITCHGSRHVLQQQNTHLVRIEGELATVVMQLCQSFCSIGSVYE